MHPFDQILLLLMGILDKPIHKGLMDWLDSVKAEAERSDTTQDRAIYLRGCADTINESLELWNMFREGVKKECQNSTADTFSESTSLLN